MELIDTDDDSSGELLQDIIDQLPLVNAAHFDIPRIMLLIQEDVATFGTLVERIDEVFQQTTFTNDAKLVQIKQLLAGTLKGQKVLIFTSYHDTAKYLFNKLSDDLKWCESAGKPVIDCITGATKGEERERIVQRFAPEANRPSGGQVGRSKEPVDKEIQILISTDVLSEGQNLQDSGVVINYDLHWNPVRLIQRAGRVDRIGSTFPYIQLYNVFPEDALESLLGIVARLSKRIAEIDRTVGLDGSVLGEVISERSLEQIRRLHSNDKQVMTDIESQAELISTEDMKFPLIQYIQQLGQNIVADIPMGIHSAKLYRARDARPGVFLAFKTGDRHFWRFYPTDGSDPETRLHVLYSMIACDRDQVRLDPGPPPYDVIERATRDILATIQTTMIQSQTSPPLTTLTQKLYHWLNSPNLWQGVSEIDSDIRSRLNAVLSQVSFKPFERDKTLREIMKNFEQNNDFIKFVEEFDAYCSENGLYEQTTTDEEVMASIKEEELQLVCYMILYS